MKFFSVLTLMRPANIVTAVTDIIAGIAIAGFLTIDKFDLRTFLAINLLLIATKCLYAGGIIFNDVFDLEADKINRPERILPRGLVTKNEATAIASAFLGAGIAAAFMVSAISGALATGIALLALVYNKYSKHYPVIGPLNMGLCRGSNLLLGMTICNGFVNTHWYMGIIPIVFIAAVTLTAAKEDTGKNVSSVAIALVLDLVVVALFLALGLRYGMNVQVSLPFLLIWLGINIFAKTTAIRRNEPALIRRAVKTGVLSLIILDASYVAGYAGWLYALPVIALLPVSILLAKKFAVT